jgi:hypothetical protein
LSYKKIGRTTYRILYKKPKKVLDMKRKILKRKTGVKMGTTGKLRFELLTAMSMKLAVFWDVAPYSQVDIYSLLFRM